MGPIGVQEMIAVFVIALILFGPKKLPELGRIIGKGLSEFRRAKSELKATFETHLNELERETRITSTSVPAVMEKPAAPRYSYPYDEDGTYESGSAASGTSLEQAQTPVSELNGEPSVAHTLPLADTVPRGSSTPQEEHHS